MRPLDGVLIVDVTAAVQGPFANSLLADLGASVVRITTPAGEIMRRVGPFKRKFPMALLSVARGRTACVGIDLKSSSGRATLLDLVRRADVFIENWKPGTAERLGLGREQLAAINPRLAYLSASGFGQTGPLSSAGSMDAISAGSSGLSSVSGRAGGPSEKVRFPLLDLTSAMVTTEMALCAILLRHLTGEPQRGETSQLEAGTAMVSPVLNIPDDAMLAGPFDKWRTPSGLFRSADGWIALHVQADAHWRALCDRLRIDAPASWSTLSGRVAARAEISARVAGAIRALSAVDALALLQEAGIPSGPVRRSVAEAMNDPRLVDRHIVWRHSDRAGWVAVVRSPWDFEGLDVAVGHVRPESDQSGAIDWDTLLGAAPAARAGAPIGAEEGQ